MTTFLLIRHATHSWIKRGLAGRMPGVNLSEEGRTEAEALAAHLAHVPIDAIYSSPLNRTRQTAAFLAKDRHLDIVYDAAFLEIDFGRWTGLAFDALRDDADWRAWNEHRESARTPEGEFMRDVRQRAVDQIGHLAHRHEDEVTAIVSHGDVIRAVITHCLGWSLDRILEFDIDPASVTLVEWEGGVGRVMILNHPAATLKMPWSSQLADEATELSFAPDLVR